MITFSKLGNYGAMGNQLFQYAALFGISRKTGLEMRIPKPPSNVDGNLEIIGHYNNEYQNPIEKYDYALDCFNISSDYLTPSDINFINEKKNYRSKKIIQYREPHFHFDPKVFEIQDSANIFGYFQSEKYFSHCSDEIRNEFRVKSSIMKIAKEKLYYYKNGAEKVISLHVRRAGHETVDLQKVHKFPDIGYYVKAMDYLKNKIDNPKFLVFSDDIEWCKNNFYSYDIVLSEGNSAIIDFAIMSLCDHNVIVGSAFSWWASWLNKNKNKKVIFPDGELFGPKGPRDTEDYYTDYFIKI